MTKDEAKFVIDRYIDEIEVDGKIFLDKECVLDLIDKIDNTNGQYQHPDGYGMHDFLWTSSNPYANTCPYTSSDTKS